MRLINTKNCILMLKYHHLKTMNKIISVNNTEAVQQGVEFLKTGCVVAIPTDTLYGLACDATNKEAISKMYNIKQRNEQKPIAMCFSEIDDIKNWADINNIPNNLLDNLLPGPVTLILNSLHPTKRNNDFLLTMSAEEKIGIRIPNHTFTRTLCKELNRPLALTSANLSDELSAVSCKEFQKIWHKIPAIFDGGVTHSNRAGSTIVDLSETGIFHILRPGIAYNDTIKVLKQFGLKNKYN